MPHNSFTTQLVSISYAAQWGLNLMIEKIHCGTIKAETCHINK